MTQEFVHLNWNQFTESAKGAFQNLWTSGDFTDVTLACADGEQVKAHKIILSSCSPFFKKILLNNTHKHPLIYMKGVDMKYLKFLVKFIYTGEVEIENEILSNFLEVADELQISGLTKTVDLKQKQDYGSLQNETAASKNVVEKVPPVSEYVADQSVLNPNKCKTCLKEFTTNANLKAHVLAIHEGVKHVCSYCPFKTGFTQNLRKHIQSQHNTNTLELGQVVKTEDIVETNETAEISATENMPVGSGHFCDHCSMELKSGKALMKHRNEEHPGLGFYCSECEKEFKSNSNLKMHRRAVHEGVKIPCESCDSIFTNGSNLNVHKKKKHTL